MTIGRSFPGFMLIAALLLPLSAVAIEPIQPLPKSINYDEAKALLGKKLFSDKNLSGDSKVSCASCHSLSTSGADTNPVSYGVYMKPGAVNAPTVFNSYFNFRQFWDGRARDLKEQASGPLHNPVEMGISREKALSYLNAHRGYTEEFRQVYGKPRIEYEDILDAIAEFEKALITPNAKIDRYLRGEVELSANEHQGYILFKRLGCASCHNGINIGGNSFQYMGVVVPYDKEILKGDLYGRTEDPFDRNRYKVPSLRNIALTAPYMHNGTVANLRDMVITMAYYNIGMELSDDEVDRIIDFLHTLTGETPDILVEP